MITLSIQNVSFWYREASKIISGLSIDIQDNQIVVLLGANGVGKSTFLKLCLGYLQPTEGEVLIYGNNLRTQPHSFIGKNIAYTPQSPAYPYHLTVLDYILLGRTPHLHSYESPQFKDREIVSEILETLEINHLAYRTLQEISGGEKQLAAFGRVIAQNTPILLLDEITSDLDIRNTLKVIQVLSELKKNHTILLSTHDPQIAEAIADTLILFQPNQIIKTGPPASLLTPDNLSDTYSIPSSAIAENPIQILWNRQMEKEA